jgi:molybdenum cofactor biosynthesis enzyme MoaA
MDININLELTDHCNIKCGMCSQSLRDEAHGVPKRFMAWQTWKKALAGLAEMSDEVHLCPHWLGEPTIHPQFDKFVEYAFAINRDNRLFRSFKLHTNGVVLGEQRARLLVDLANAPGQAADTFRWVHFSIDAFSQPVYTAVKGADKREQVYKNIHRFLDIRAAKASPWPKVTIAFVVQPGNHHEAGEFVEHWREALRAHGSEATLTYDWPSHLVDSIYMRPLNTGDQVSSDRLHAETVRALGVKTPEGERLRATGSF